MSEPICAYLLDTANGWVLLDTGFDSAHAQDAERREANFYRHGMVPPVVLPEHELLPQLEGLGLKPADIQHVIVTHLHFDHVGGLKHFPHARASIQRREYEVRLQHDIRSGYIQEDYDSPSIKWDVVDGDWQVMPGLNMIDTRGHTAGHQSAVLELPSSGVVVLPFDAGDLQENFDDEVLPGESVDDAAAMQAILRIKSILAERNGRMLLFHDPVAIQKIKLAPDFYD